MYGKLLLRSTDRKGETGLQSGRYQRRQYFRDGQDAHTCHTMATHAKLHDQSPQFDGRRNPRHRLMAVFNPFLPGARILSHSQIIGSLIQRLFSTRLY